METIIRDEIVKHMDSNNLFADEQYGFVSGRSCTTQLLEFMEEITEAIDRDVDVDIKYFDFCKAFDKVSHRRYSSNSKVKAKKENFLCGLRISSLTDDSE